MVIPRHSRMGTVNEFDEEGCYTVDSDTHGFAAAAWEPKGVKVTAFEEVTKLDNGISIYDKEPSATAAFRQVCENFPEIWQDTRPVRVPESEHMRILLKEG